MNEPLPPSKEHSQEDFAGPGDTIPEAPGVYIMKDKQGKIIYVGKSVNLKARVRSYFSGGDPRPFVKRLGKLLGTIETIETQSETEALLLENNLIKLHKPRFNVMLRDDKNYLSLRIDSKEKWPRVEVRRRRAAASKKDTGKYFGPYRSSRALRQTMGLLGRHFMLRTCPDHVLNNRSRPCLQYQIKRCPAPCVLDISKEAYQDNVQEAILFLEGRTEELSGKLTDKMMQASEAMEFEAAARYRDQLSAITKMMEPQQADNPHGLDQDVFGHYREGDRLTIQLLIIRNGRMEGTEVFSFKDHDVPDEEVYSSFLNLYYQGGQTIPNEVILPVDLEDAVALGELLGQMRGTKVAVTTPRRGRKHDLVQSAMRNAQNTFKSQQAGQDHTQDLLEKLQKVLKLRNWPDRIECFDISNFQGKQVVGSMVVFENGQIAKEAYRHFKIKTVDGQDDFASMYEVLQRRLKRTVDGDWPKPDLIVIDGGKGQLGQAVTLMQDLGIHDVDCIGLAKSRVASDVTSSTVERSLERVFLPGRKNPLILRQNSAELFLLQRVRDEAHRFAITFHRSQRRKATLKSTLDDIPGVGPGRRKALLEHFGAVAKIRNASIEELSAVSGISQKLARQIFAFFNSEQALEP